MSPPSSVTVSGVSNPYDIGQPVAVDCTVIAIVLDPRNTARIRWAGINNVIDISPTTVNGTHYINYTYPLTISNASLSDAGQYRCIARILSNEIDNVINSDTVIKAKEINVKCKYVSIFFSCFRIFY